MTETSLTVKWTTSKARDTYGYNICTLTDTTTGKKYRCNGGGYDMLGTSFGQWLQDVHQDTLRNIASDAYTRWTFAETGPYGQERNDRGHYGMSAYHNEDGSLSYIHLEGATGLGNVIHIAEVIGLTVRKLMNRKGNVEGFIVSDGQ